MKTVTVTWVEQVRQTQTYEVDDDWQERGEDGTESSAAEELITNMEGDTQSYAVLERDVLDVFID